MKTIESSPASKPATSRTACPRCGETGKPVKPVALESLLKPDARACVGSAVIASACCWLPLLLLAFGVSGVAVSATFEKMLWVVTAIALAFVFFPNYIGALRAAGGTPDSAPIWTNTSWPWTAWTARGARRDWKSN